MAPSLRESDPEEDVRLYGFPPAAEADAQILILGSMPSEASLKAGAYYAHPRNRFWPLMGALLGFDPETLYEKRIEALKKNRIALWDTIGSCERTGSLDSAILRPEVNPIGAFLAAHSGIRLVCLNGSLPSTSPANARWRLEDLVRTWGKAILPELSSDP